MDDFIIRQHGAQVCVVKKIKEANVNVKQQRVGERSLRHGEQLCKGEQKDSDSTPGGFVYFLHLERG